MDVKGTRLLLVTWSVLVAGCGGGGSSGSGTPPPVVDNPPTTSQPPPPPPPVTTPDPPPPPPVSLTVSPTTGCVISHGQLAINAVVTNDLGNAGVRWSVPLGSCYGTGCGSLSSVTPQSVLFTAPAAADPAQSIPVTATSIADSTRSVTLQVMITGVSVGLAPKHAALTPSQTQSFTASTVAGCGSPGVTWTVDGVVGGNATVGTIDTNGKYTPPAAPGTHVVSVASVFDPSRSDSASVAVTDLSAIATHHYDSARTGQNTHEYGLTPTALRAHAFGKMFSCSVDGDIYAEPLYVANLPIANGVHNVVFVATQHDSVYAFDADLAECRTYWHDSFLSPGVTTIPAAAVGESSNMPEVGIIGTPVIDVAHGTLFVVAATQATGGVASQMLHALDLASGAEKANSPATITGVDPLLQSQRAALLLSGNNVYVSWGSHDDLGAYHGIMQGYDSSSLAPVATFNSTPHGVQGAIWMSGSGPADDGAGNIFLATGNGTFDSNNDLGDSVVRLGTSSGLSVTGTFTPFNQLSFFTNDIDLGAGGVTLLPDSVGSSAHPHLMLLGTKNADLLLLDRDNPGGFTVGGPDQIVQSLSFANAPVYSFGFFSTPAVWNGTVYIGAGYDVLRAYSISNATLSAVPIAQSAETQGRMGATPVVSSQGTTNGVVWALQNDASGTVNGGLSGPAILRAYDATNLALLYSSDAAAADACGNAVKFTVPTVANGKVYVGGQRQMTVYGLLR